MSDEFKSADWAREALAKKAPAINEAAHWVKRPGIRMIPFEFSQTETYQLVDPLCLAPIDDLRAVRFVFEALGAPKDVLR